MKRPLKRHVQRLMQSMTTRVFLILFAGIVVTAALSLTLALQERARMIGQFREYQAVERVFQFIQSLETIPPELRFAFYNATPGGGMRAEASTPGEAVLNQKSALVQQLERRLPDGYRIQSAAPRASDCDTPRARRRNQEGRGPCEALLVVLPDGERLRLSVLPPRPPPFVPRFEIGSASLLFLVSIGLLAALVARMTMRPLKRLAQAATELGHDIDRPALPETGAREIRQAAAAFNAMQSRIRQHIRQRTQILAAITHDLQTPLTRLRLRLEKVDDVELREKLVSDLAAMQSMVREGLDLARSLDSGEPLRLLDLDSLVDSVCSDALDAGQDVHVERRCHAQVMARPAALRRCLENLIGNAVKYGTEARISCETADESVIIRIADSGPGIPPDEVEKVFEPFYRLETSRSRETGGTGLGLTIARNIAQQHGGKVELRNMASGLEVVLSLPSRQSG
ncbi:MAG TPA: ATP-binding protein [Noviherbaspirillum sp.]